MKLAIRVLMNGRDVTPWLTEATVEQPRRTLYRQAALVFAGWSAIEDGARWDVYASHDPDVDPYAEVLLRSGIAPADRVRRLNVTTAGGAELAVTVYDRVWQAQRRAPEATLVLVPDAGGASVTAALERYDGPVGAYRVLTHVGTYHQAVERLAALAGFRVRVLLPDEPLLPFVVDPAASYWSAIVELLKPWAPATHYNRANNELIFSSPLAPVYGVGRSLTIPAAGVESIRGWPSRYRRVRRVLIRFPGR